MSGLGDIIVIIMAELVKTLFILGLRDVIVVTLGFVEISVILQCGC